MDAVPDFATKPTLQGRLVRVRPFRDGDAEVMVEILSDPEVRRLGLRRITLEVLEFNPRAQRAYEKVGYVVTGVRPDELVFDGVAVAAVDMAVDAEHWRGFPTAPAG